jgi:hypothetical protein
MAKTYTFTAIVDGGLLPQTRDPRVSVFSQAPFGFSAEQMAPEFLLWERINPGIHGLMRNSTLLGLPVFQVSWDLFRRHLKRLVSSTDTLRCGPSFEKRPRFENSGKIP